MERAVVHLASGLSERHFDVSVVCIENEGLLATELHSCDVPTFALRSRKSRDLKAALRLYRYLKEWQPDVVNVHDYASAPYAVLANWLTGRRSKVVFTAHGLLYEDFETLRRRCRFFSKGFDALSAVSTQGAERHREYLEWRRAIQLFPNGIPDRWTGMEKKRNNIRQSIGLGPECFVFLSVGNVRPEKGFENLVEASVQLGADKRDSGSFAVLIAGALPETPYCNGLIRSLGQKGRSGIVRFLGFRNDVEMLYGAADAFVLSSRSEGLPLALLEAMMAGLPVVATRVGGVPDAVGDHGILVDPEKPEELAKGMKRLLSDPEGAREMGKIARTHAKAHFGVDRMVDEYLSLYKRVVAKG